MEVSAVVLRFECPLMRLDDLILANQIGEAGDEGLKVLAERERDKIAATIHFNGNTSLQISGKVRQRVINSESLRNHNFIVVVEPQFQGFPVKAVPEYAVLLFSSLPRGW